VRCGRKTQDCVPCEDGATSRLARLEAQSAARRAYTFFYGWLKPLPPTCTGERHTALVKRTPTTSPSVEWCEFEERVGAVPRDRSRMLLQTSDEGDWATALESAASQQERRK